MLPLSFSKMRLSRGTKVCIWLLIAASPRAFAVDGGTGLALEAAAVDGIFACAGFGLVTGLIMDSFEIQKGRHSHTSSGTVKQYFGQVTIGSALSAKDM